MAKFSPKIRAAEGHGVWEVISEQLSALLGRDVSVLGKAAHRAEENVGYRTIVGEIVDTLQYPKL
jgi:hypothetical protein